MAIQNLSSVDALSSGDRLPLYSASSGGDRSASLTSLLAFVQANITTQDDKTTAYNSPLTGFFYTVSPAVEGASVYLRLTPAGTLATGTISLPTPAHDKQEVLVKSTQAITALTISSGAVGATVSGAPTSLAAGGFFTLRYDAVSGVWDRVA